MTGAIEDNAANSDKIRRLRDRRFLDEDNNIGIMVVKGNEEEFFERIPELDAACKSRYADMALEYAMNESKGYPPQMQDLVLCQEAEAFIGSACALRAMEILYGDGTFRPLTDREKVAANLLMFSDVLPIKQSDITIHSRPPGNGRPVRWQKFRNCRKITDATCLDESPEIQGKRLSTRISYL